MTMSTVAPPDEDIQVPVPELLGRLLDLNGSDLHLTAGTPPTVRIHGELERLEDYPPLNPRSLQGMIYAILPQKMRERFEQELELDMSYSLPGRARFRVNVFMQRDAVGAVFRVIPFDIKNIVDLGLPPVAADLARFPRGFVVVTGPTGSGKSTTLAAMVDVVNTERSGHIMTVEDPIEFLHKHKKCVVNQREIGADTHSFASALKHVLRQDPDVILVGEMRDLETISTAITAAETGHLVFATLHTQDAPQTIDRIIDVFPPHQQQQVRVQLSTTLQGVVTQQLIPTVDGRGRVLGVKGGEDEVAGLGGGECGRDRLEVAHLADENHVGVLPQRRFQRFGEARRVRADLALVDDAALVPVHELDRILDGENVVGTGAVDLVDHRRERRRLTGARRSGDEHEPARVLGEGVEHLWQVQLLERLDLLRDQAEGSADRLALVVDVHAEAGNARHRVREVELAVQLEMLLLLAREDAVEERARVVRGERLEALGADDMPANPVRRRTPDRHVKVGSAERDHLLEQVVDGSQLRHGRPSYELSARRCTALSPASATRCEGGESPKRG
jgi:pilus retraction protein PilT